MLFSELIRQFYNIYYVSKTTWVTTFTKEACLGCCVCVTAVEDSSKYSDHEFKGCVQYGACR